MREGLPRRTGAKTAARNRLASTKLTVSAGAMALALLLNGCTSSSGVTPAQHGNPASNGVACSTSNTRPAGMPVLTLAQLPPQAVATLRLIAAGGPYPYTADNTVYGNYSGALPRERYGYYHEFTVVTPGSTTRGARRVVTGADGEDYYTSDHYASFDWITCAS